MPQRLSELLAIRTEFNFFRSIANLEPFDLKRLESVVNDLLHYLSQIEDIFKHLKSYEKDIGRDFEWVSEGNSKFYDIYRNIDSVDSIVLQALNLLENNMDKDADIVNADVFDNLDKLSEISLSLKQDYLLSFKTRVDIAVEYNEICNITMNSINHELEHCLKKCFKIHEKRFSSPVRHAPSFNLEMLTNKLLQQRSNLRLPLLNEIDNELYEEYLELKTIVDPLRASLSFIPLRIEEFGSKYKDVDQYYVSELNEKYRSLVKELDYLQNEVRDLKYDLVDSRWNEIFSYLNTEMSFLISGVQKELTKIDNLGDDNSSFKSQILKRLKYTTKIVENTFTLINQAIDEELIEFKVTEKSNELADAWLTLKSKIQVEFLEKLEDDEEIEVSSSEITKSFKTLALDETKIDEPKSNGTSVRDKRRSRAGQFLMGKMNLVPVLIEGDPTSVKKPEDLPNIHRNILTESFKPNHIDVSPSKSRPSTTSLLKIPALRSSLSVELNFEDDTPSSQKSNSFNHPITSIEESPAKQVHEDTLSLLEANSQSESEDIFQTPVPNSRRSTSDSSVIIAKPTGSKIPNLSKIPVPESFQSRIPRPSSRVGVSDRASSSLGTRTLNRPATALGLSRNGNNRPPSRSSAVLNRHSMMPQTPIRSSTTSKRRSLLPQPTPIKEIMEIRAETRLEAKEQVLGGKTQSRLEGRRSALGGRTHLYHDLQVKKGWK